MNKDDVVNRIKEMVSFELVKEKGKGVSSCHELGTKKEKMNDNEEFVLT